MSLVSEKTVLGEFDESPLAEAYLRGAIHYLSSDRDRGGPETDIVYARTALSARGWELVAREVGGRVVYRSVKINGGSDQ